MRDLSKLNINIGGNPVQRPAPNPETIAAYEREFNLKLPDELVQLLNHSNGGHPELDSFAVKGGRDDDRWAVNSFYHLDEERDSSGSLWLMTRRWRPYIGEQAVPFASDGGGNQFFLDLRTTPAVVKVCIHDDNFRVIELAASFGEFIDGLEIDPNMV